jgi:hypothetical protein
MPLLKLSNWHRQQGTDFAQPRAKEEHGVRLVRTSRSKSATAHKSAGLDSSTSSTASSCSGDDGSSPPMLTLSVGIAPPRKSCLTVWTFAESLGDADQFNGTMSHCNAVVRRKPKSVTWSQTIQVQHYTTILGDHPCTSRGPPISLGLPVGRPMNKNMAPLGTTTPTASTLELLIPADVRERILIKGGLLAFGVAKHGVPDPAHQVGALRKCETDFVGSIGQDHSKSQQETIIFSLATSLLMPPKDRDLVV